MGRTPMWRRYLRFWGSDASADVDAELDHHLGELVELLVREGHRPAEARAEAERRFGDYAEVKEACVDIDQSWERQQRWQRLLADFWQDLRVGARTLAKNPGFAISAVLVLGLGLGAATVMVSVINAVFIRPLPFPEPDRIVSVVRHDSRFRGANEFHPQRNVAVLRDRSKAFEALAGIGISPGINLVSQHGSTFISRVEVTADYFQVFEVAPRLGRAFSREDEVAPSTVVLSHDVWVGHFGGDHGIIGQVVRLGGRPHTVIGVMPSGFWSFEQADAWTPFRPDPSGGDQNYRLIGRLGAGWTPAQAQAELRAASTDLHADLREPRDEARLDVQSYHESVAAGTGGLVWSLTAAVGAILLLVCANAAGLQVARTVGRRQELALRAALGGLRGRLLRQLLTESVLLATAGGAVGALAAATGVSGLVALRPRLAIWDITVDAPVLFGTVAIAVLTGVLFGLLPGALAVRSEAADTLRGGQSRSVTTAHASWMRRSLVVAQVALCTMLLVSAGVFLRTFAGLSTSDLGFDPANVLTARASLEGPAYGSRDAVAALYRRTLAELRSLPGVEAAAVANNLPVERGLQMLLLQRPDNRMEPAEADWRYVAGDYLDVLRIPLVAGRALSAADHRAAAPPVALVNEMFASRFGGRAVLGTRLQMTAVEVDDQMREVVGILGDVRTRGVTATRPTVFVPVEQVPDDLLAEAHGFFQVNWVLRTRQGATGLVRSVERVIGEADPLLPITAIRTMDDVVGAAIAATRSRTFLLGLFAVAALTLAAAGLYGFVAYTVAQRTKEIGIRLALGASRGRVTARLALQGVVLSATGSVLGAGAAALFTVALRRMTPDALPLDSWTVAGVVFVLGAVSIAATVVPAVRATQVDPATTLRAE